MATELPAQYWATDPAKLMASLASTPQGLSADEAARRLQSHGTNSVGDDSRVRPLKLLARQFESPLVLVLIFGAVLSYVLQQWVDGSIILVIVVSSALLGFYQEYAASDRKSTRLNSSHGGISRMPSSA